MTALPLQLYHLLAWHDRWAVKSRIIPLLLIYPVFPLVLFPWIGDVGDFGILDVHLYYNAETAYNLLKSYDAAAFANYRLCALTVDMVYPVFYAFLISLLIASVLRRRYTAGQSIHWLRAAPFIIMLVDWFENLTIVRLMDQWPIFDADLANIAGLLTFTKWSLLAVVMSLLIVVWLLSFKQSDLKS